MFIACLIGGGGHVGTIGDIRITPFILVMNVSYFFVFTIGWLKGGHPERFGVAVLLSYELLEGLHRQWRIGDSELSQALFSALAHERTAGRVVLALIFAWLAFRSPRWWPLAATASLVLIVLVHLMQIMTLIPFNGAASARVGLWLLLYTVVLAGALERWMAGEAPISRIGRDGVGTALQAGRACPSGETVITAFVIAAYVVACLSFIAGWLKGGHPERLGAAAMICDIAFTVAIFRTSVAEAAAATSTFVVTLIVIWLAFRSDRWWPLVAAASMILSVLVSLLQWLGPGLSGDAAQSAHVGLWIVVYLALLGGVGERWLAGERTVSEGLRWRKRADAAP